MEAALRTRKSAHRQRSDSGLSRSSASSRKTLSGLRGVRETSSCSPEENTSTSSSPCTSSSPLIPQHTPLLHRLFRSYSETTQSNVADQVEPFSSTRCLHHFDSSPIFTPSSACSTSSSSSSRHKLRHIVEEMVTTEREYVRSLRYIIHHYFPEMDRVGLPQDLRGKRSVIFGNLEKLLDFHSQFFLRELEACWKHPLRVPHCFLRHEQFGLYALYSKNKPKSDTLKQVELGDKMDLSSYLLKPIQRMSKYALLLTDLMKEVGVAQEAELFALQEATQMVKFQLRHGNDLLAVLGKVPWLTAD
uniref:DH domain-containing protein n=1 Tax=Monopterus albus TaxID=43700 RepID=A0A3Q3JK23_MONAL